MGSANVSAGLVSEGASGSQIRSGGSQMYSGITSVIQAANQERLAELMPPIVQGNINSGDVMYSSGQLRIGCLYKSIKKEYAMIVDSFLTKYGYKVNEIKIPNLNTRTNWNYIKTIGIVINAKNGTDVLQGDLAELKAIYNKGITIWHNPSTMFDYSQSNNIVS